MITPFYDSLLVKVTAWGREFTQACQRMDRAFARVSHPRRENQHSVPRERGQPSRFPVGRGHHAFLDETPELFHFVPGATAPRDCSPISAR